MSFEKKPSTISMDVMAALNPLAVQFEAGVPVPSFCGLHCAYNLDEKLEDITQADLQVGFTGFNMLVASKTTMEAMTSMTGEKQEWGMMGQGLLLFGPRLFKANVIPKKLEVMDVQLLTSFLGKIFIHQFGYTGRGLVVQMPNIELMQQSILPFALSIPVTQQVWQETFNLKSLEMTAALKYFESVGGKMAVDAPVMPADIAHGRTLN